MKESWKSNVSAAEKRIEGKFPDAEGNHLTPEERKDLRAILSKLSS